MRTVPLVCLALTICLLVSKPCSSDVPSSAAHDLRQFRSTLYAPAGIRYHVDATSSISMLGPITHYAADVVIEKKGKFLIHLKASDGDRVTILAGGDSLIVYDQDAKRYSVDRSAESKFDTVDALMDEFVRFFGIKTGVPADVRSVLDLPAIYLNGSIGSGDLANVTDQVKSIRGKKTIEVVESINSSQIDERQTWDIEPRTYLPLTWKEHDWDPNGSWDNSTIQALTNVRFLGSPLPASAYQFTPPKDVAKLTLVQTSSNSQ